MSGATVLAPVPNRCGNCDRFVEYSEPLRAPTADEMTKHVSVRDVDLVARARCNACNRDVLALHPVES